MLNVKDHPPWQSLSLLRALPICPVLAMKRYTGHWQRKAQGDMQRGDWHSWHCAETLLTGVVSQVC